ncbi:hypothetical protein [Flammeovirga sp. EKP202]|uniref:hypothetical protein n=1 Tax=Flammeovirga sp. EKP202 TaxID=2770592 RepID=UPI00165FECC3|nr:hypothetical protein [Flammeovirga sp. EKP202]MBD0400827.1 hypothetical protein [Flammeovirga sp. EKP202]
MNKGNPIFIISNEPWGDIWYSKHHYANELSKLNHQVYFINSPSYWTFSHLFDWSIKVNKVSENLYYVDYNNLLPVRIFKDVCRNINDFINCLKLSRISKKGIFWQFDPTRFGNTNSLGRFKKIYHVVDPYMKWSSDKQIAQSSDLIICTSKKYLSHYKGITKGEKVIYIPHGLSEDEKITDFDKVEQIKKKEGNYILLVGTINHDIDFSILEGLVEIFKIIVLGKEVITDNKWDILKKHPNLHYKGMIHAQELKYYISASTLCITSYKFTLQSSGGNRSPLKILNYLAQYKPIVVSTDSEIPTLEGKVIFKASSVEEFIQLAIEKQTILDDDQRLQIDQYLMNHRYPKLIEQIFEYV